jgi:hypothetical protein
VPHPGCPAKARSGVLVANELMGSVAVALLVLLPWALGGIDPTREDLTWAILLSFGAAVASVFVLVLSPSTSPVEAIQAAPRSPRRHADASLAGGAAVNGAAPRP